MRLWLCNVPRVDSTLTVEWVASNPVHAPKMSCSKALLHPFSCTSQSTSALQVQSYRTMHMSAVLTKHMVWTNEWNTHSTTLSHTSPLLQSMQRPLVQQSMTHWGWRKANYTKAWVWRVDDWNISNVGIPLNLTKVPSCKVRFKMMLRLAFTGFQKWSFGVTYCWATIICSRCDISYQSQPDQMWSYAAVILHNMIVHAMA